MRTITFLGVLFMFANAQANGLPIDAKILRVRCGSTCEQSDTLTLQAGIKEKNLGVTVEAWAFMSDEVSQTYPHLMSGAIWIIGTTANGETFWDDPLDHHLATMEQVREFVRQRGYTKVEVGRNRRHGAKLVLPSAVPVCQRGLANCTQVVDSMISEYNKGIQQLALVTLVHQREMECARRNRQYNPEVDECTNVPLVVVANAKPAMPLVVNSAPPKVVSDGPTWPFWLAIIVLIVVVVIQQWIICDRVRVLKSEREAAARDVAAERAVREADRQAVFHWGMRLCDVAERIGLPTIDGYEDRLVEALARRLDGHTNPPNPVNSA